MHYLSTKLRLCDAHMTPGIFAGAIAAIGAFQRCVLGQGGVANMVECS